MRTSTKVRAGSILLLVTTAVILRSATQSTDQLIISGIEPDEHIHVAISANGFHDSIIPIRSNISDIGQFSGSRGSIFIVSDRHRPIFVSDVEWTDLSDRVIAALEPYDTLSVAVHILTDRADEARRMLSEQIAEANRLFGKEHSGLAFRVDSITVAPELEAIPAYVARTFAARFDEAAIASPARIEQYFFVPGMINIYSVDHIGAGENLAWRHEISADGSKVVIGIPVSLNVPSILAHELGHALGLRHPDASDDPRTAPMATPYNVMHDRSNSRAFFSDGQIFRMNFSVASALRSVYRRKRPYVDCGADSRSTNCPGIFLDIWSDAYPAPATADEPASSSESSH